MVERIAPFRPLRQPIGAVVLVAVQHIGELLRQVISTYAAGVSAQVMRQRCELWVGQPLRQSAQDAPGQRGFVQRHGGGQTVCAQHAAVNLPQLAGGQDHVRGCANTQRVVLRQRHRQPMLHAVALHQHGFRA